MHDYNRYCRQELSLCNMDILLTCRHSMHSMHSVLLMKQASKVCSARSLRAQDVHNINAVNAQQHHKGLRKVSVQTKSAYRCVYTVIMCVTSAYQRSSRAAFGDLTTLSLRPHIVSFTCLSERRAMAHTSYMLNERAKTWYLQCFTTATNKDAFALLRSRGFCCMYLGVLHYIRTKLGRLEDAGVKRNRVYYQYLVLNECIICMGDLK